MGNKLKAHLAVLMANILYGASYTIAKEVMPQFIKPFGFIVIRVWCAMILFVITAQLFFKEKIDRKDYPRFILCAIFGVAMNQLLFFKGLSLTSPINSGLMMVTNPIFVLLMTGIFMNEIINPRRILGITCGIVGAVSLILLGNHSNLNSNSSSLGDLFVLINSLSYAIYLVMVKPLMKKYHPVTIMQMVFCFGALMVLPFGYSEFRSIDWSSFSSNIWAAVVFIIFGITFLAYLLNTLALKELSPAVVSIYIYLQPLLAAGFAILVGRDSLHLIHFIAASLIFLGVYLTTSGIAVKNRLN